MKSISFKLGGKWRSLLPPKDAACWAFQENETEGQAVMFFRMKKVSEHSQLTSLRLACQEIPDLKWQSTGTLPYLETEAGLDDDTPSYAQVNFKKGSDGEWAMVFENGFGEFVARQNDLASGPAAFPTSALKSEQHVLDFLMALMQNPAGQEG